MKKILFVTIDPIEHRRRLLNQIAAAQKAGFAAEVISCAEFGKHYPKETVPFPIRRINLPLDRGPLKFLLFNVKLFFIIWLKSYDVIQARGLWTLPAIIQYLLGHRTRLIYSAHEYFAGHQIFLARPLRKFIWMAVERFAISFVDVLITVSEPLAEAYRKRYPRLKEARVIRSLPSLTGFAPESVSRVKTDTQYFTFVFHGYFHHGRALEQIILAFENLKDLPVRLLLIGKGPLKNKLETLVRLKHLNKKIIFKDFIPNRELIGFIRQADVGLSLIQADSINRMYSLPNKFFEYLMAGLPVLASTIPTLEAYVEKYQVGLCADPEDPQAIAAAMRCMFTDNEKRNRWRKNSLKAAKELNWEKEEQKMLKIYRCFL